MLTKLMHAVFSSNHHAILSKCYERYLNDTELTALSGMYHILYPNINQFEQPVSRRHLICSDIEIHGERFFCHVLVCRAGVSCDTTVCLSKHRDILRLWRCISTYSVISTIRHICEGCTIYHFTFTQVVCASTATAQWVI